MITGRRALVVSLVPLLALACSSSTVEDARVRITVAQGATIGMVAESLAARGLIESADVFRFYARITGRRRALKAGTYEVSRGIAYLRLLDLLATGRGVALERLVIPEGLMLAELARQVEAQLELPAESVLAAARDSTLRADLGISTATLDGYLYPSTYYVRTDATAREVVRQMVAEFASRWKAAWTARLDTVGLTRHELVTLASIIEAEVRHPADRRYVSSVYHNRLDRGMRLQADPTVIYALGRRRRLFERDYQTPSPYNTYLIDGLPPGPIVQPSASSIEAALYPANTDFLYLVARPDGLHIFSRTLPEHLAAVRQVRRER